MKYQLVKWREFHICFIRGNPLRLPAAFHLIYKWSLWLGWWEVRKFLTDAEMKKALQIYNSELLNK
ncbi:MAG TPA: hypothetical protein PKN32_14770 [Bacteroidales bacterium]|jgi:hypothetical protein|nr:hypothetical protein [Bacteroidales bacterium]